MTITTDSELERHFNQRQHQILSVRSSPPTNVILAQALDVKGSDGNAARQIAEALRTAGVTPSRIERIGDLLAREGHMRGRE